MLGQSRIQNDPIAKDHPIMSQVHGSFYHKHRNFTIPAGDLFALHAYRYCLQIKEHSIINAVEAGAVFDVFTALCLEKWKLVGVAQ